MDYRGTKDSHKILSETTYCRLHKNKGTIKWTKQKWMNNKKNLQTILGDFIHIVNMIKPDTN